MSPVRNLISDGVNIRYLDAHCHLQFGEYDADRGALIDRMRAEGVAAVVVGTDRDSSEAAVALAEKHEHLFASVGLHPNLATGERYDISYLSRLSEHPKVVAIGECGLDFYRPADVTEAVKEVQRAVLRQHIELAASCGKPLIIHCRPSKGTMDAYDELIALLKEAKIAHADLRGDAHFFVGGAREAEALAALGFTVSFTAVVTFARDYDAVIRALPLSDILAETDAPYVAPEGRRGKRNDPLAVIDVVARIASIRGDDPEIVRAALLSNAEELFL